MNKVIITGNLTKDPEAYTTQSGIARSTFTVAVQRRFANAQGVRETDFLTVIAWRQTADFCNKYLIKGRKVLVEGSIQTRSYDAQDGSKRYVTEIIADHVEALGSREDNRPAEAPSAPPQQQRMDASTDDFKEVDPGDELPF
jgi:single-strand DNA-binding protein